MKNVLCFLLLSCSSIVFAQGNGGADKTYMNTQLQYEGVYVTANDLQVEEEAKVYLFPEWEGKYEVYLSEKEGYSFSNLNYNVRTNTLESKISKDSVFRFEIGRIDFIKHASRKYKLYRIHESSELFQEIYVSENVVFLKGFNTILRKGTINPLTLEYIQRDEYSIVEKFYVKLKEGNFVQLSLKKKSVLELFGNKANQVNKYASNSKLSFKSEPDLFKIFLYYDTL